MTGRLQALVTGASSGIGLTIARALGNRGYGLTLAARPRGDRSPLPRPELSVNLRGTVLATREALPLLCQSGSEHGRSMVVNIASLTGKAPVAGLSVYSATKAALIAFSAAIQAETLAAGVKVTALCPGLVDTPMAQSVGGEPEEMLPTDDIARVVEFLLDTSANCLVPEIVLSPRAHELPSF